jgi:hypothetical protein
VMWLIALTTALALAVVVLAVMTVYRTLVERRRSEARIAALAAAIDNPHWEAAFDDEEAPLETITPPAVSLVVPDVVRPSRVPAFAIGGLVILAASALLIAGMGGSHRARPDVPPAASSIELVSMHHVLDGETLIVSGFVRNPTVSATPSLLAVVSVIGRDGQVVARGESPLEPAFLGPGRETGFRVLVPKVSDPGRYRVAFMNGSRIVPHVDRRTELSRTALASDTRGN